MLLFKIFTAMLQSLLIVVTAAPVDTENATSLEDAFSEQRDYFAIHRDVPSSDALAGFNQPEPGDIAGLNITMAKAKPHGPPYCECTTVDGDVFNVLIGRY